MKFWALFSGGKDSTACVEVLSDENKLAGILSIDTGISAPDWLPFIQAQSARWNVPHEIIKTTADYDQLVCKYGFPGPGLHGLFMNYLKGRAVRQFKKRYRSEKLASGVRAYESTRRFKKTREWGEFEGVAVWAPLFNWTTEAVWRFVNERGFKRSPAYEVLCISGDCLCGAYATEMERAAIKAFYPCVDERLKRLETLTNKLWGWGNNKGKRSGAPVCVDCEAQGELAL